jgi:uncharacterized protein (TIGR04255 family)
VEADIDQPFGDVPLTRHVLLGNNRIEAAVIEVRFVGDDKTFSAVDAAAMLDVLKERTSITRLDTAEQRELSVTFAGGEAQPSVEVVSRGWRFFSADENEMITVFPNVAIIQVRGYRRWSDSFRPLLEATLAAVTLNGAPSLVQRVGLRYINRLTGTPGEPASVWAGRIAPAFAGPLAEPIVGALLRGAHQQLELELETDVGAIIRHGLVPNPADNEYGYLIDLDVFHTGSASFTDRYVVWCAQRLNRTAARLFQRMLTDEQIDTMDPVALDAPTVEGQLQ